MTKTQRKLKLTKLRLQHHSIEVQITDIEDQLSLMKKYQRHQPESVLQSMLFELKMKLRNLDYEIKELTDEIADQ